MFLLLPFSSYYAWKSLNREKISNYMPDKDNKIKFELSPLDSLKRKEVEKEIDAELNYEKELNKKRAKAIKEENRKYIDRYVEYFEGQKNIRGRLVNIGWDPLGYFMIFTPSLKISYIKNSKTRKIVDYMFLQKTPLKHYFELSKEKHFEYTSKRNLENLAERYNKHEKEKVKLNELQKEDYFKERSQIK
ncbi:hypothetical protein HYT91_00590, partial [Candidatus Pacearchaeota archaeon]|nr:hypothetical protein [Candidatus Pacearchaeota archaeon]